MSRFIVKGTLSSAVADSGTFTVSYPDRVAPELGITDEGEFARAMQHSLIMGQGNVKFPIGFTLTFGTANITVTNGSGASWPVGTPWILGLEIEGKPIHRSDFSTGKTVARTSKAVVVVVRLGAPDVGDVNGICEAQSLSAGAMALDGDLVSGGVAVLDVPRNVIIDSGGADTAVITITGEDEYGVGMSEAITLNGTTAVIGKKAFKKITGCVTGATIANAAFVGTGTKLGLPVYLPGLGNIMFENADHALATGGTVVAGVRVKATTTTGDVRGTVDPDTAPNGAIVLEVVLGLPDPQYLGTPQNLA